MVPELLAHRGVWRVADERNRPAALSEALARGFGLETDVRDVDGRLMIAHDVGDPAAFLAEDLASEIRRLKKRPLIALNVKADGLQNLIRACFAECGARLYLFDMSVPDHWRSLSAGLPCLTRLSDIEPYPVLTERSEGFWVDAMNRDWLTRGTLMNLIEQHVGKWVMLVSPDLHGRPHRDYWAMIKDLPPMDQAKVALCTDRPDEAREFFA